jgi:hypothetical protein
MFRGGTRGPATRTVVTLAVVGHHSGRERLTSLDQRFRTHTNGGVREGDEEPAMKKLCVTQHIEICEAGIQIEPNRISRLRIDSQDAALVSC